ncbi:MAG: hypothetical protein Q4G68_08120 [Planctomycetia bacterium]|nr:hypothetical protein [Planctomycetia bacterium]
MKYYFTMLTICLCVICLAGCGGPQKPDGFPETVPFTLTVMRDGSPLPEASVQLYPETASDAATGGITDAQGVVSLATTRGNYSNSGSPVGTFKVTVSKRVTIPGELSREECLKMSPDESAAYSKKMEEAEKSVPPEVAEKYHSVATTPLSVTVTKGGNATVQVTAK